MKKLLKILLIIVVSILLLAVIGSFFPDEGTVETTDTAESAVEKPTLTVKETHGKIFLNERVRYTTYDVSKIDTASLISYCENNVVDSFAADFFLFYESDEKGIWLEGMESKEMVWFLIADKCPNLIVVLNWGEGATVMDCKDFKP